MYETKQIIRNQRSVKNGLVVRKMKKMTFCSDSI